MKRYVAAMIRDAKTEEGLTEENFKVCGSSGANNGDCKLLQFITGHLLHRDYGCNYMLYVNLVLL